MKWTQGSQDTSDVIDLRDNTSFLGRLHNALYGAQAYGGQLLDTAKREYQAGVAQKNGTTPVSNVPVVGFQGNALTPQNVQRVIPQKVSIY
jgi:hypothetical protein